MFAVRMRLGRSRCSLGGLASMDLYRRSARGCVARAHVELYSRRASRSCHDISAAEPLRDAAAAAVGHRPVRFSHNWPMVTEDRSALAAARSGGARDPGDAGGDAALAARLHQAALRSNPFGAAVTSTSLPTSAGATTTGPLPRTCTRCR